MKYLKLYENFSEEWDDEDEEEEDDTLDSVFEIINGYGGYDTYIKVNYNELRRYFEVNGILIEGIMVENNKDWGDEQFSEYELYSHIYPRYDKVDEEVILKIDNDFKSLSFIETIVNNIKYNTFILNFKRGIGVELC